jgi:hypothetical protein
MELHNNEACKVKCECIVTTLVGIQELLEYPRSDREQHIKCAVDIALQDIRYLSNDMKEADNDKT